jgi:hypothetical protein
MAGIILPRGKKVISENGLGRMKSAIFRAALWGTLRFESRTSDFPAGELRVVMSGTSLALPENLKTL